MPNRLATASSPYLLQHADNPVDWFEWGIEAFDVAGDTGRPVMLSVGYATCHWCHVMAHESFEDPVTAAYLNEHFVSVKVDREERPDVDRIYMDAVQAMTGQGGWPMTVFLTADGAPFLAGTYYPKAARGGYPSFRQVLESVVDAWANRRPELADQAQRLTAVVRTGIPVADTAPAADTLQRAVDAWLASFDRTYGGFGGAPKFPQVPNLELVLRLLASGSMPDRADDLRMMLTATLDSMHAGGIYDHLAGGFARYATDRRWLIPHFEKMLYDNAQLARLYLRAWQVTGIERYRVVAVETLEYLLTDLADPAGGFHSGEDADAAGVEGSHAVWTWDDLGDVLGDERPFAAAAYGATPEGNFEGSNILQLADDLAVVADRLGISLRDAEQRLARIRRLLLVRRRTRVQPAVDDKVVTAWNGLALTAFAEAAGVLNDARFRGAAVDLAEFMVANLMTEDGGLLRSWRHGRPGPGGFCDDYAATAIGLFAVYALTGERPWFE
ncbi:MAG: thioredoxin domain-containing protein, partial [Acidimicrobiia bacterium]|nr:thioredoxin domain-containing protein [Acidimicrobiia bacterium]